MRTVLWVLLESLRHIGIVLQPITPRIASELLDQVAVGLDKRSFRALAAEEEGGTPLQSGTLLPEPRIVVPRFDPGEDGDAIVTAPASAEVWNGSDGKSGAQLSGSELKKLEAHVREQASRVRELKERGGDKDVVRSEVDALLELKSRLPKGHELAGGGGMKKAK